MAIIFRPSSHTSATGTVSLNPRIQNVAADFFATHCSEINSVQNVLKVALQIPEVTYIY
jgi:hypothetical protein